MGGHAVKCDVAWLNSTIAALASGEEGVVEGMATAEWFSRFMF